MHSCWPQSLHRPRRILFRCWSLASDGILDALEYPANLMGLDCLYHMWKTLIFWTKRCIGCGMFWGISRDASWWPTESSTKVWETFKIEDKSWKFKLVFFCVVVNKRNAHNIFWYSVSNTVGTEEEKWCC